jgi:mutator protein MutT
MSYRAAAILIESGLVALIERHKEGRHYFTFPGGHIDEGETPEHAVVREIEEELGLQVAIKRLVAEIGWHGRPQFYYLVERIGGTFGTGHGEEMNNPLPEKGSYLPMWLPVDALLEEPVLPREVAEMIFRFVKEGWPETPVVIPEN